MYCCIGIYVGQQINWLNIRVLFTIRKAVLVNMLHKYLLTSYTIWCPR